MKTIVPQPGHIYWKWQWNDRPLHLKDLWHKLGPYEMQWWYMDDEVFAFNEAWVEYLDYCRIVSVPTWESSKYGRCWSNRRVTR